MKQKLLSIMISLLGISAVYAQVNTLPTNGFRASSVKMTGQVKAASTDESLYFGYCDNTIAQGVGMGQVTGGSAAICMPAALSSLYAGKTISKIRVGMYAACTNVSVWIRNSLSGPSAVIQTVGNVDQGWTEVTLSTPFTIPTGDFYIGYTSTGLFPFGFSGNTVYDGCWLWDSNGGWNNYAGSNWGSLCLQAEIDAQGATILAMQPENLPATIQGSLNQNFSLPCNVNNYSSVAVTSVKVSYQIDNQTSVEETIQTSIAPMAAGIVNIPINALTSTGIYNLSVTIPEINGQPNPMANIALNSQIRILSQSFPKKVVFEEGTGTWCGWCVRGAVGMAMMEEKYPDTFIGIAVHDNDPMTLPAYDSYIAGNFIQSFPGVVVDRKAILIGDPYYDSDNFYQSEITQTPIAGIQLTGSFTDTGKTAIKLNTVTTFGITSGNANYRLAYVLTENNVTGYDQANYYAGGGSGQMGGYENRPDDITDMVFNDVARGIYSDPTGIQGSIPASITTMTPITHTYTITLPASIQNADNLSVVVMLLNATTGEIENADKIDMSGDNTGITVPKTDAVHVYATGGNLYIESGVSESVSIYTVSGVKLYDTAKTPGVLSIFSGRFPKGVLIVKGNSGWVKKVENY